MCVPSGVTSEGIPRKAQEGKAVIIANFSALDATKIFQYNTYLQFLGEKLLHEEWSYYDNL
jgi:hypothetical protein